MSAALLLDACRRIDAGAAAVRVYMIGCSDGAAETNGDNVAWRQLALLGIVEVIAVAQKDLQNTPGGDDFHGLPLHFFVEMVYAAEQALWVALCEKGNGAPCNADLCELLGLALQWHTAAKAARPGPAVAAAGRAGKGRKDGAA